MAVDEQVQVAFGKALREARLNEGLSQERLALDSNVDRTFISMLERGIRQPSLGTLFALAKTLGVRPSRLISSVEHEIES